MEERFLLFQAGGQRYACPLQEVSEVMEPQPSYPIPGAPPHYLGLINFHGALTALVDLAACLAAGRFRGPGKLLVLDTKRAALALRVDGVSGIVSGDAVTVESREEGDSDCSRLTTAQGEFRLLQLEALLLKLEQELNQ